MRIIDLFCGIGSFHQASGDCVFACDSDKYVRQIYKQNWGIEPEGSIEDVTTVPDHDVLCAGFPCQPFSNIGLKLGTDDPRGRLFDHIIRILKQKRPRGCVLENVQGLLGTAYFYEIVKELEKLGYTVYYKVLSADRYGIPQMRKRLFIVGLLDNLGFEFPPEIETPTLAEFLGKPFVKTCAYTVRCGGRGGTVGEKHNWDTYRLEDGTDYRLSVDDCMRLQGFDPVGWDWSGVSVSRRMKMLGNTIPVCLTRAVLGAVKKSLV